MPSLSDEHPIANAHNSDVLRHDTKDGSTTLYSTHFQQYYHNPNGALSESEIVFFSNTGLNELIEKKGQDVHIFEMGFGTGLNFLLAAHKMMTAVNRNALHFYSVEAFPIDPETAKGFSYPIQWVKTELNHWIPNILSDVHPGWNTFQPDPKWPIYLHLYVGFLKELGELSCLDHPIDVYFHDAFSVEQNPECWTYEVFTCYRQWGHSKSILSTYAAATQVRAAMAAANWSVYKAPGALGKREMTLACSTQSNNLFEDAKPCPNERLKQRWFRGEWS